MPEALHRDKNLNSHTIYGDGFSFLLLSSIQKIAENGRTPSYDYIVIGSWLI
ncbi:MAG: hypothetical protein CM15mP113_3240 [Pseudomonadota bacterium]|nr:MAG: hypothetical protein CM15mP113_3240 [Pseudomonadota bacterium]